jgi:hypothetical protein
MYSAYPVKSKLRIIALTGTFPRTWVLLLSHNTKKRNIILYTYTMLTYCTGTLPISTCISRLREM